MPFRMARPGRRERLLREELDRVVEVVKDRGVEKIILFGSLAGDKVGPRSDLDLMVVERTDKVALRPARGGVLGRAARVAMDILVYTPEEMRRLSSSRAFVRLALKGGKILYER